MKVLTLILILYLSSLYTSNYVKLNMMSELDMRKAFYKDLIKKYNMEDRVELETDEDNHDLYLKAKMDLKGSMPIGGAETKFFFTSCNYYPFMEIINKAIYSYAKSTNEKDTQQFFVTFNLLYNILYHKLGDSIKTRAYYEKVDDFKEFIKAKYINFEVDAEVKRYILSLPFYTTRSILNLKDEEIKVAESLNMNFNFRNNAFNFFDFIVNYVKENTSEEVQKLMNLFVTKKDDYVATLNFINSKKFFINNEFFIKYNIITKDHGYFTNFLSTLFENGRYLTECKLIAPLVDLFKFEIPTIINETPNLTHFNTFRDDFIGFTTNGSFSKGDIIRVDNIDRMSSEFNFLLHGRVPEENLFDTVDFKYTISKEDITPSQVDYCEETRCASFDIRAAINDPESKGIAFNFNVSNGNINDEILKIMKIFYIKKIHQSIKPFIQLNMPFNYNVEVKSLTNYLTFLMKFKSDLKEENFLDVYYKNKKLLKNKLEKDKKNPNVAMFEEDDDKPRLDVLDSIYQVMHKKLQIVNFNVQRTFEKISKTAMDDIKKALKI
jgi:hypothetical protein